MRQIIIGFSTPRGWFKPYAWAIRFFEATPYSHVYVKTFSNSTSQWLIYQASGHQVNFMGERFFLRAAKVIHEFKFEITEEAFKRYMQWSILNAGAPYDLKSVIGVAAMKLLGLRKNPFSDGDRAYYCAELVARALKDFLNRDISAAEFETAGPRRIYQICELLSFKEKV